MTYAILYIENGDFIADFDSEDAARAALADFLRENPSVRDRVGLLAFGDDGLPVGDALSADELLPA
jgi:hypothetical protein